MIEEIPKMSDDLSQEKKGFLARRKWWIIGGVSVVVIVSIIVGVIMYIKYGPEEYNFSDLSISNCSQIRASESPALDHSLWNDVLSQYVSANKQKDGITFNSFNYHGLQNDRATFDEYLEYLDTVPTTGLSCDEQRALWINSYNALAVDVMLKGGIPKSIRDLSDVTTEVWKKPAGNVGGREYTLDGIEKGILLQYLPDDRLHAAVNCASLSCPDLRTEAYTAAKVQAQLEEQSELWVKNPTKGHIITDGKSKVSMLFFWYKSDFDRDSGSAQGFIEKHGGGKPTDSVSYMQYNWDRNEAEDSASVGAAHLHNISFAFCGLMALLI